MRAKTSRDGAMLGKVLGGFRRVGAARVAIRPPRHRAAKFRVEALEGRSLMAASPLTAVTHHAGPPAAEVATMAVPRDPHPDLTALKARARPAAAQFVYKHHSVDISQVPRADRGELATYIRQQIDLVESLPIARAQKKWFRSVPITVTPGLPSPGMYSSKGGLKLDDSTSPADNPVLLHELLHAYQATRLSADGEATVAAAYEQAKTNPAYPAGSYMLSNEHEFFAMTGSVVLWGKAARPPSTRETVKEAQPDYYDFLVREFGLQVS